MLHEEYKELDISIKDLNSSLESIYTILHKILSNPAKSFDLTFKTARGIAAFKVRPPFTKEERTEMGKSKKTFISLMLSHVLKKRIKHIEDPIEVETMYEMVYALAYGEEPKDHKVSKESIKESLDEIKEHVVGQTSILLDEDSHHVKTQRLEQ